MKKPYLINNNGSVADIRCSLSFGSTKEDLEASLEDEKKKRNRITVITMLERALKKKNK